MINEYNARLDMDAPPSNSDLHNIATEMVPFFLKHNAEPDACDLLMELESIDSIVQYLDINTFTRVATDLAMFARSPPPQVLSSTHLVIVLPTTCLHPTMSRLYVWCIASTGNSTNYPNPSSLPSNSTTSNSSGMTLTSAPIRSKRNNSPTFSPGSMKTLKSRMTSSTTFSPMPSCQSTFWVWPENWTCWNPRRPKTFTSRTSKIPVPS